MTQQPQPYKISPTGIDGVANIVDRESGEVVGQVLKTERRFNLAGSRGLGTKVTHWTAKQRDPNSSSPLFIDLRTTPYVPSQPMNVKTGEPAGPLRAFRFDTRADAAAAVWEALENEQREAARVLPNLDRAEVEQLRDAEGTADWLRRYCEVDLEGRDEFDADSRGIDPRAWHVYIKAAPNGADATTRLEAAVDAGVNPAALRAEQTLDEKVREVSGLIETGSADEVIGYLDAGNEAAACEVLATNYHLQMGAGNAGRAEALDAVAQAIDAARDDEGTPGVTVEVDGAALISDLEEPLTLLVGGRRVGIAAGIDEQGTPFISLRAIDCDLDGEEPGLYYLVPQGEGRGQGH